MTSPRLVPVLLLACGALLAACGSSGTASGASPSASASASATTGSGAGAGVANPTTPCSSASFGSPLQPKDAPANVHVYPTQPATQIGSNKLYQATISTARGDIVMCLQPKLAPNTVNNFVVLARNHYYDKLTFHRVVPGFVIQGGDPAGNGSGGPGYQFNDEPVLGEYAPGCVAMAKTSQPNTSGSQFFICTADDARLPKTYNLFGTVSKGMDVALKIQPGDVMASVTVQEQA
jgi:cyclophilin family peptidyl-prolyl cis-trans isomerase